jgi:hypothetical protein
VQQEILSSMQSEIKQACRQRQNSASCDHTHSPHGFHHLAILFQKNSQKYLATEDEFLPKFQ